MKLPYKNHEPLFLEWFRNLTEEEALNYIFEWQRSKQYNPKWHFFNTTTKRTWGKTAQISIARLTLKSTNGSPNSNSIGFLVKLVPISRLIDLILKEFADQEMLLDLSYYYLHAYRKKYVHGKKDLAALAKLELTVSPVLGSA